MSNWEAIVMVLLAVNGFWGFCALGLLNSLNRKFDAFLNTMADFCDTLADQAERK